MDLNLSTLEVTYSSNDLMRMPFKVGSSNYCFYYHKSIDSIHCNCSAYETESNLKQVRKCIEKYIKDNIPKLTPKQKKFFSKPQSMEAVWKRLFNGDAFEANNFQNWALSNNLIEWNGSTFKLTE